jgi:hypothetical protein
MKNSFLILLFALCFNTSWADFLDTAVCSHPLYAAANEPYLLDISGDWSSDCHPGEQKPVISEYTGDSALIEFETITDHVTCNDVVTPYRVLVDMSDVIESVPGEFPFIDVTIRFGGAEYMKRVMRPCLLCSPVPPPRDVKPEAGLYYSNGLEKQGLLLARQNQRMGAYPLFYDESGSSEWAIGPGGIVEDVFFAELFESTGGQCLDCPPPDEPPRLDAVGKISMLMDNEGVIQVRINDGLFTTYELLDFGFGGRDIGGYPSHRIPDLSGRWAFVEDIVKAPQLPPSDSNTSLIPLVFDITLESVIGPLVYPTVGAPDPRPPGYIMFSIRSKNANEVAKMKCDYGADWANSDAEMVCIMNNSEINDGDPLYRVKMLSPERLTIDWVGPVISEIRIATLIAVRVD